MMRSPGWLLPGLVLAALAAVTGCGGAGSTAGSTDGSVDVLLTDAPLLTVNGRTFSELNVEITAFEASVPGTHTFSSFTLAATTVTENLLDLTNDNEWVAFTMLPPGDYDRFRLTIDTGTAHLIEDNASNTRQDLVVADPNGQITFVLAPPLHVDPAGAHLVIVDWDAHRSVGYRPATGEYVLSGFLVAHTVNRSAAPVPFRALPARIMSVDTSSGEMRVYMERHSRAQYLVRTNPTTGTGPSGVTPAALVDMQGTLLTINDFGAGDYVIISGAFDEHLDIDATRICLLPSASNQPPARPGPGPNPGPGPGPGPGPNAPPAGPTAGQPVFAAGVIHQLDATAHTFTLASHHRGPVDVTYSDTTTAFWDVRVPPRQPSSAAALQDGLVVEVGGVYVPPATAGVNPGIDATGANGAPGAITIIR